MSRGWEIAANVLNALSIVLAGCNSVHTWWIGISGCVLFGAVFFGAKLYADVTLQAFFVGTSFIGKKGVSPEKGSVPSIDTSA